MRERGQNLADPSEPLVGKRSTSCRTTGTRHVIVEALIELAGEPSGPEASATGALAEARAILEIAREAITIDQLRAIEIIYPAGDLPSWLRKALAVMMPKLALAVATEAVDGGPAVSSNQMLSGEMTDVLEGVFLGLAAEVRVELRLTVEKREGRSFTLTLLNDGRDISVRFGAEASPGLRTWHINVPEESIKALESPSTD